MEGMEKNLKELPRAFGFGSALASAVAFAASESRRRRGHRRGDGWVMSIYRTVLYSSYAQADRFGLVLVLGCGDSTTT